MKKQVWVILSNDARDEHFDTFMGVFEVNGLSEQEVLNRFAVDRKLDVDDRKKLTAQMTDLETL